MKTAIVTGATSMLGIATIKQLIENEIRVIAISRANSRRIGALPKSEYIEFIDCDLVRLNHLAESCDKEGLWINEACVGKADVIYHFAWGYTDKSTRDNQELQDLNIEYTLDAIRLAHRMGCSRFIGAGSQAEYGFKDYEIFENSDCTPGVAYGKSKINACKRAMESCAEYHMDFIWPRIFSVYGVNDSQSTLVSYVLSQYRKGEVAKLSSGVQMWNFLFEEDAGEYFYLLGNADRAKFAAVDNNMLKNDLVSGIINVGNKDSKQLRNYVYEMRDILGEKFTFEFEPESSVKPGGIWPNVDKLIKITGYEPKYSFSDGITAILNSKISNWRV